MKSTDRTLEQQRQDKNKDSLGRFAARTWPESAQLLSPVVPDAPVSEPKPRQRFNGETIAGHIDDLEDIRDASHVRGTFEATYDGPFESSPWRVENSSFTDSTLTGSYDFHGGSVVRSTIDTGEFGSLDFDATTVRLTSVNHDRDAGIAVGANGYGDTTIKNGSKVTSGWLNTAVSVHGSTVDDCSIAHLANGSDSRVKNCSIVSIDRMEGGSLHLCSMSGPSQQKYVYSLKNVDVQGFRVNRVHFSGDVDCPNNTVNMKAEDADFRGINVRARELSGHYVDCHFENSRLSGLVTGELNRCYMGGADLTEARFSAKPGSYVFYDEKTVFPRGYDKDADRNISWIHHSGKDRYEEQRNEQFLAELKRLHGVD